MKTIICNFQSNGEKIKKTAVINDNLSELSKSKKNEATDIIDDYIAEDNVWILFFEENDHLGYEVQFKVDKKENKTLTPVKSITWEGGDDAVITDVQKVKVIIK